MEATREGGSGADPPSQQTFGRSESAGLKVRERSVSHTAYRATLGQILGRPEYCEHWSLVRSRGTIRLVGHACLSFDGEIVQLGYASGQTVVNDGCSILFPPKV